MSTTSNVQQYRGVDSDGRPYTVTLDGATVRVDIDGVAPVVVRCRTGRAAGDEFRAWTQPPALP